jgi:mRNA interferase MazF
MTRLTVTFNAFDVVVVPFPFTDRQATKRRPAVVISDALSFNSRVGQSVLAMITSAQHSDWPLDVDIDDLDAAGLPASSLVRMKLFTLDDRLVLRKAGELGEDDRNKVSGALRQLLGLANSSA